MGEITFQQAIKYLMDVQIATRQRIVTVILGEYEEIYTKEWN